MRVRLIEIPVFSDHRGSVSVLEDLPFTVRRVFYIYDVPYESVRGRHALKTCHQILVAVSGTFNVIVDGETHYLTSPGVGLYIPPMAWRELTRFGPTTVCLVLASHPYDEDDYIRDYDEFESLRL